MRWLRTWRGSSCLLVVLWALVLLAPHGLRGVVARLGPGAFRGGAMVRPRATAGAVERGGATQTAPGTAVLGHARATHFVAGSNLKGDAAGAAWLFLLPSLELELVLFVGVPSAPTLRTLSRLAREVVVACDGAGDRRRLRRRSAGVGATNVRALTPGEALQADLAVVSGPRWPVADGALRRAVLGARAAFVDPGRRRDNGRAGRELAAASTLRLAPATGEPRSAAAARDAATVAYLEEVAPPARRAPLRRRKEDRRGVLAHAEAGGRHLTTPSYVRHIAAAAGVDLGDHRVGLIAPSEYASRKAVLFLFRGQDEAPELVVKLTRDGAHNARLENEWRALRWLEDARLPDSGAPPRPAFFGHHAGLAVLGETAVTGAPFRSRTTARADCPLALGALGWLLDLGAASAHPAADNGQVATALGDLLARFERLYRLSAGERARLHRHVGVVAEAARPLPLVMQHGDPGAWNLLVGADGRPAFLDWEAAEPEGMPLWDIFYFVRSFSVTVARAAGVRSSLRAVRRELLDDGPVNALLVGAVERQCDQIGLDRELVEPLLTTCWMHRALKEATRLPPRRLDRGHYVKLLRLTLREPAAPGLRRLFGTG
jgi:hypothetical protein